MKSKRNASPYSLAQAARDYGPLCVVLLVGSFLRIYQLGTESFWYDEWVSREFAYLESSSELLEQTKSDNNFPTNYLILHYWVWLFGGSEFSLRFPTALAGILAILAIYKVGKLLFDRGTALMASLILALSPFHIYYSQEARPYELAALLALLSFYFFLKVLKERTLITQVGYILCTSVFMYLHVYSLFAVLAQNIYFTTLLLVRRAFGSRGKDLSGLRRQHGAQPSSGRDEVRLGFWRWVMLQALLLALYIPGLILLVGWVFDPLSQGRRGWIQPPTLDSVYGVFVNYSGNSPRLLVLLLTFSLLAVVGLVRGGGASKLYLLLLWLLVPVAVPVAISIFYSPIFAPPYAIAAMLALYLLAAKGVKVTSAIFSRMFPPGGTPKAWKAGAVWLAVATVMIVLLLPEIKVYFNVWTKPQWREAAQYVSIHAQPDDLVLLYPEWEQRLFDYYDESNEKTEIEQQSVPGNPDMAQEPVPSILSAIQNHDRVWAVDDQRTFPEELFPDRFFEDSHTLVYRQSYSGIELSLYERRLAKGD